MDWLTPAITATLIGSLILTFMYFFLYSQEKQKFLLIWSIGWLIFCIRFIFTLVNLIQEDQIWLTIGTHTSSLLSGTFLLWGSYEFTDRRFPIWWWAGTIIGFIWILLATLNSASLLITTIPIYTLLAGVNIWTGIIIINSHLAQGQSKYLTGWAFILWGIHKADFPFLRTVAWFAPWGFMLGSVLEFFVAIGMLSVYYEIRRSESKKSEELLREVINSMEKAIAIYEPVDQGDDFKFVDLNEYGEKITQYKVEDVLGKTIKELFPGEPSIGLIAKLKETWESGKSTQIPLKQYVDDRITQWVENYIFKLPSGKVVAMFEDTFELRAAEKALEESEQRFRMFFETNAEFCYMVSQEGDILNINRRALEMLEYSKDEILGKPLIPTIYAPESQEKAKQLFESWKKTGKIRNQELTIISKSGKKRHVLLSADAVKDSEGNIIHSTSIQADITEQRVAQDELKNFNEELEQRVTERTDRLQILVDSMAGREVRMSQLKKVIKQLRKQLVEAGLEPSANDPLAVDE